jgi:hypothetical protein
MMFSYLYVCLKTCHAEIRRAIEAGDEGRRQQLDLDDNCTLVGIESILSLFCLNVISKGRNKMSRKNKPMSGTVCFVKS